MSYIITGARLLGYNHQNIFLADAFRLNSIKNYTVEGFFLQTTNTSGVSGNLSLESGMAQSLKEKEEIIVNGVNLGPARITSITFNSNNPVRLDTYTISFNVLTSGQNDLYNMNGNLYLGVKSSLGNTTHLLEVFDENFSFNLTEDNAYNYSHNLNIRYRNTSGYLSPINLAKNLAYNIFSSAPNIGFIDDNYAGYYTNAGKKYFTENYNLITNDCSFTKTFNILSASADDYTLVLTQNLTFGNDGNIEVTEQGNIKGLVGDLISAAENGLSIQLNNSLSRCQGVFNRYKSSNALSNANSLFSTPLETIRTYNRFNGEAQYTVKYTNNLGFKPLYTLDTTLTFNKNNLNIIEVEENGNLRVYGNKSANFTTAFDSSSVNSALGAAALRITTFYGEQGGNKNLVIIKKNINYPKYGQNVSYNMKYSDDPAYNVNIAGIKKLVIKTSDTAANHMYNQYIIPNKKVFSVAGGQTELGQREATIECIVDRPNGSIFNINPMGTVNLLKGIAINALAKNFPKVSPKEAYVTKCEYNFDSDLNLTLNVGIDYTAIVQKYSNQRVL